MTYFLYDENSTRLKLVKSIAGSSSKVLNFIFLPGGPGADSSYYMPLLNNMNAAGNYWLVDLIYYGTNDKYQKSIDEACSNWPKYIEAVAANFDNVVLISHSAAGYISLCCPNLEKYLKGFVMLHSTPSIKSDSYKVNDYKDEIERFISNPTRENLHNFFKKEASLIFNKQNLEKGLKALEDMQLNLETNHWWYSKGTEAYDEIKWIPQSVPTLLVTGEDDFVTPGSIFAADKRFDRKNIQMKSIKNVGHFSLIDDPLLIAGTLDEFIQTKVG